MRTLFFIPICPFSRKVRIMLNERKLDFLPMIEQVWKKREEFFELNPIGQAPVLVDLNNKVICDSSVICEYIDETYSDHSLLGEDILQRAETRRIMAWMDGKFYQQVTHKLVFEKTLKRFFYQQGPDSSVIRQGTANLAHHFDYLTWLIERRNWLAGDDFSLADIVAAAHLSSIDYVGSIAWEKYPEVKEWYGRIKSRPSMRTLLADQIPGVSAPTYYRDIDF